MLFEYLKMHGAGNRILVVDERSRKRPPPAADKLRELGNESTGPGFDQLLWVLPATAKAAAASYRVFNADGSEVEQCGNGVRCLAWMLARGSSEDTFLLESPAGHVQAKIAGDAVSVSMGLPVFEPARIPFVAETEALMYQLELNSGDIDVSVLSMGNPHCVVDVPDAAGAPVAALGPEIESHSRFPARTNVGFLELMNPGEVLLRVHERGVGETPACGTGACAAVVSAMRRGLVRDEVTVNLPGGQLVVSWRRPADPVWLTGNAELICEGTIDL